MLTQGLVGQPTASATGANPTVRSGSLGDVVVSELHGKYMRQALNGNLYHLSNQAAVSTTAALATTWTGLAISNPAGSGVNAVVNLFGASQFAAGAAGSIGIMTGSGVAAGSVVPRNCLISGATGKVTGSAGATIATPVLDYVFGQVGSLATTGYGVTPGVYVDLAGSLIIPPGFYAATYTTVATTTALIFTFQWEEVPIAVI